MPQTLGAWTLAKRLGQGGQGRVFLATRTIREGEGKPFALKRLSRTDSPKARARFAREIEALTRISHPAIVQPIDHSQPDDPQPYYVMRYEEGVRPLSDLIWPEDRASEYEGNAFACLTFIARCADALAAAHAANVIHRDLKPDNILVRQDGTPLIIDFGCCLFLDDEGMLTLTDEGVGARNFMAPECEAGIEGETSAHSDIYSLGKILWCMMCGERPFSRERAGFTNKLITARMPDDPEAGFVVEAMLQSVRTEPTHRAKSASDFAELCTSFARRIDAGASHVSYTAPRCVACHSEEVTISQDRIGDRLPLDAFVFIGNKANNPHLHAKFCLDCGCVTLHDTRPYDAYKKQLSGAT
jgi:serine/threonine protein kinase